MSGHRYDRWRDELRLPPPFDSVHYDEVFRAVGDLPHSLERAEFMLDVLEQELERVVRVLQDDDHFKVRDVVLKEPVLDADEHPMEPYYKFYQLHQRCYGEHGPDKLREIVEALVAYPDVDTALEAYWRLWVGTAHGRALTGTILYLEKNIKAEADNPAARRFVDIASRYWRRMPKHIASGLIFAADDIAGAGAFDLLDSVADSPPNDPPFIDIPSDGKSLRDDARSMKKNRLIRMGLIPVPPPPEEEEDEDEYPYDDDD